MLDFSKFSSINFWNIWTINILAKYYDIFGFIIDNKVMIDYIYSYPNDMRANSSEATLSLMLKLTWSAHPKFSMIRDPISRQVVHHKAHQIIVPTCERPMVREDPKLRGSLNTPDERCTCQVRMAGSVGFLFLALPILTFWWFFLGFFAKFGVCKPKLL